MNFRTLFTALTSAAMLAFSGTAFAATPGTVWVNTASQGVSLSKLASVTDIGPLPSSRPLTIRVGLQLQNKAALLKFISSVSSPSSPQFGKFLTPQQFAASYAPSNTQVAQVVTYLQNAGFSNITIEPNHLLISADGTAAQAAAAFNTSFEQFYQFNKTVFANLSPAQVPAALGGIVSAVLGLNSVGQMKPALALPSQAPQYLVSYTPAQLLHIYGGEGTAPASGTSIAIMAEGDMTGVINDLRIAEQAFGLPQVPVEVVQVGLPSSDTSGADEWDMDTQYSSGMAGNLKTLYIYTTTSLSDSDLALEFSRWATDNKARAASASLGECEVFPYIDGSMVVDDMIFLEAAAQGQTFFASSGDTGSFCPVGAGTNGVPAGVPLVQYPSSSPYVVGVGGTTLLTNTDGNYNTETSWNAGGGGLSQFELPGAWQTAAVSLLGSTNTRAVPDIALVADPESGASVYVNGAAEGVGGTSLSSPMALGIWARAVNANPRLGFASIPLYGLYDGTGLLGAYPYGGFHDVTVGVNGLYAAGPGYDLNTGLGTPWINQMVQALATK